MRRVLRLLSAIGPGLFAIGYTIGTGSVTSMAKAGSDYGLGLLWVLALSCFFSGVLMEAYGRMAAVTGETSLHAIKRFLPGGKGLAAALFACIVLGQYAGVFCAAHHTAHAGLDLEVVGIDIGYLYAGGNSLLVEDAEHLTDESFLTRTAVDN